MVKPHLALELAMRTIALTSISLLLLACGQQAASFEPDRTPILTTITVAPDSLYLIATGQEAPLVAVAKDQFGNVMTGVAFSWNSDNTPVATVSSTGVVRAGAESCLAIVRATAVTKANRIISSNGVSVTVLLPGTSTPATGPVLSGCARRG
jgi:hypothetical protein